MENFIVTFARGFGSGGKDIASMLAKDLGIHCYENRILTLASQMSGLDEKLFLDINERIRSNGGFTGFLRGLPRSRQYIARNEKFVSDDRLFEYQSHHKKSGRSGILRDRGKMCRLCAEGQKKRSKYLYRSTSFLLSGAYHAADESFRRCGSSNH